ncbi:MAG: thermonuclease family protein [Cardiobacterium sp.]
MKRLFTALFWALFVGNALAYEITGKVIGVADGDTLTILDDSKTQHKIRLADIDAPEKGQPYGNRARQRLQQLAAGKVAHADCREKDKYGRDVCTVTVDGIDVNADLVASGHAWVYEQYNARADLPPMQEDAKTKGVGLWSLPEAQIIKPSDWRHGNKGVQTQVKEAKTKQAAKADSECGSKRFCKQMASCAEAKFYLQQCGLKQLDRDSDGVPCETICPGG